jgi:hypothetical protein
MYHIIGYICNHFRRRVVIIDIPRNCLAGDGSDYKVGPGGPPLHARFRRGQSGNPDGRRRKSLAVRLNRILEVLPLLRPCPALCRVSTEAGKTPALIRGWGSNPATNEKV